MGRERKDGSVGKWPLAVIFVVLLGLVSLLADVANEGSRAMMGPYLAMLGASATVVAIVAGLSELTGYSLRVVFGRLTDKTGRYWTMVFVGYGINLIAVPALALAGDWQLAVSLILIERIGRAVRGPARDAMLSHSSVDVGRGWAFGVQEALSSVGGMIGPMVVVLIMFLGGSYQLGFMLLAIPAFMAIVVLLYAYKLNPRPRDMEGVCSSSDVKRPLPKIYWFFVAGAGLVAAGYVDFPMISFYLSESGQVTSDLIPILYTLAMGADALSALVFGKIYDRKGMGILILSMLLTPIFVPLVFSGNMELMLLGMVIYGVGFGAQESIMRAIVADMVPYCRRGSAFGYYNAFFGVTWFLGSLCMGLLFDFSLVATIVLSMGLQLASVPLFLHVKRNYRFKPRGMEVA